MSQPNPRAWACFADTGNCIIWSTDEASVRSIADKHGRAVTPLCDLAEVTRATDLVADLVRELRHIEGISTGQVQRVAKQALAKLRDYGENKLVTQPHDWPGEWTHVAPQVSDHPPGAELVWSVRGEPFTRPILARTNVGARVPGFAAKAEKFVYVELMAEGFHGTHAGRYGFFDALEWRGPLVLPNAELSTRRV